MSADDPIDISEVQPIVDKVLASAVKSGSTMIRVSSEPVSATYSSVRVQFEGEGAGLPPPLSLPQAFHQPLIASLKILARANILERAVPQVGLAERIIDGRRFFFRIETAPRKNEPETCAILPIARRPVFSGPADLGLGAVVAGRVEEDGDSRESDDLSLALEDPAAEEEMLSVLPAVDGLAWTMDSRSITGTVDGALSISIPLTGAQRRIRVRFDPAFGKAARRVFLRSLPRWAPAFKVARKDLLVAACKYDDEPLIEEEFSRGVDKELATRILREIVDGAQVRLIQRFLSAGADPSAALAGALRLEVASVLVEAGADVNARSPAGFTALMSAARYGRRELMRWLIARGADLDARSDAGLFALLEATVWPAVGKSCSPREAVALLAESGADLDIADALGWTALMHAVSSDDCETMEYLLARGADRTLKNADGRTAADIARGSRPETFERFTKAAAA